MTYRAALFSSQPARILEVYRPEILSTIESQCHLHPVIITPQNLSQELPHLEGLDIIFSTWGMFIPEEQQLARLNSLKAIFYAAGATEYFAAPFRERGVKIISAWHANAIPVAEFCLAQILLSCKGYFHNQREYSAPHRFQPLTGHPVAHGIYRERVALLGAGVISQTLSQLLRPFSLEVITIPSRLERRTLSLEEAFSSAFVISNHLPNREDNRGVLNGALFRRMRPGAVFINTGRGLQVNEKELIDVFRQRPDLTALLDVTKPEPPQHGSPLYSMPNILLTSHIAGAINNETQRLAEYILDEFARWRNGEPLRYEVL